MPSYSFLTLDVFTRTRFGGNPLAVFPRAEGLSDAHMQAAAREFNLSETVFVLPPEAPGSPLRARIFTPKQEVPFAGHPVVGTACALAMEGLIPLTGDITHSQLQIPIGKLDLSIHAEKGRVKSAHFSMVKPVEIRPPAISLALLAESLGLAVEDLQVEGHSLQAAALGIPFLLVPVASLAAMAKARLDLGLWKKHLEASWAAQVYLYSPKTLDPAAIWHTRMFAPAAGIEEDPATGSAAATLAACLGATPAIAEGETRWVIEQGYEMGRPSLIEVTLAKSSPGNLAITIGGSAVKITAGSMDFDEN